MNRVNGIISGIVLAVMSCSVIAAEEKPSDPIAAHHASHFAIVNGEKISLKEYQSAFQAGMRKRFYHGKIPPEKLKEFREEVSQTLIDKVLLVNEAKRLSIKVDQTVIDQQIAHFEKRYAEKDFWKNHKSEVLPGLRTALEDENLLKKIEEHVKNVPLPSLVDAEAFYKKSPELFTTPEKMRISLILLKVLPSSPGSVWEAAKNEAEQIIQRLKNGADFAELARIHSGDATAAKGGDMGFIHQGMLAKPAQVALDKLTEKEISDPVMLLRGVAILRLEEKKPAELNTFKNVAERARKLLQRENSRLAWSNLVKELRSTAKIEINSAALNLDKSV